MKKIIFAIISVWLVFILQSTVFSKLNIGNIVPNMLIVLTASWGFMQGDKFGLTVGFACGLLMDIFFGSVIGIYALIFMYIGYFNGKFCNLFFPEDYKLPLILIIISDLMYGLSCYVFYFLLRGKFDFWYYFGHIIFPEIIATLMISLLQYPLTLLIHNKILLEKNA